MTKTAEEKNSLNKKHFKLDYVMRAPVLIPKASSNPYISGKCHCFMLETRLNQVSQRAAKGNLIRKF